MPKRSANEISLDESQFPPGWGILDEAMLQATCTAEAKVWRMVERMYGISAFELLPADEIWDLSALTKEPKIVHPVTELSLTIPIRMHNLVTLLCCPVFAGQRGLSIFRYAIKLAKWYRQRRGVEIDGSNFLLPPKPMLQVLEDGEEEPDHLDFLENLEEASYIGNKEKRGVSGEVIYRDFS
ncbi:hypothetical protein BOTNAR_1258g00020 [Botryotinia narcissicola]|uniref:Uncharacterized protein n=1 Tax=Botryotinia narcissicola TaxID=278944 RepID=A0A4Z1H8L7_9HELO|nr:hypothetical protein BOTNAR_1258g00020 [Botryotinia narcissicola]